nr:Hypothetical protein [Salmonella enterica]
MSYCIQNLISFNHSSKSLILTLWFMKIYPICSPKTFNLFNPLYRQSVIF